METLSIKVFKEDKNRLRQLARERKVSLSALLREGLAAVAAGKPEGREPTCYALAAEILEDPEQLGESGFGDLSTDKLRLEKFGK